MKKMPISEKIDLIIENIESELDACKKHVIRTDTIKNRCLNVISLGGNNSDSDYCVRVGFEQVMYSRLNVKGYRSIRNGRFVNFNSCENKSYLQSMYEREDTSIKEKEDILDRIRNKFDGQSEMIFDENGQFIGIHENMTEEEFLELIEADAI